MARVARQAPAAATAAAAERFFSNAFLMQLERLAFISKRSHVGAVKGERKSPRRGSSVEFADYRPYEVGDDLRYVDWNAFARLNRLYLKVFIDEEDLCIHLLLDASGSMDYGTPNKFRYAVRLAAALAFIGFVNLERVGVAVFRDRVAEGWLLEDAGSRNGSYLEGRRVRGCMSVGRSEDLERGRQLIVDGTDVDPDEL